MARFRASATVMDSKGTASTVQTFIEAADMAAAYDEFETFLEAFDNVTEGVITAAEVAQVMDLTLLSLKATPAANSDLEEKGLLVFFSNEAKVYPRLTIPGIVESVTMPNSDALDPTITPLLEVVQKLVGGNYRDYRGATITSLKSATKDWGRRR